MAFFVRSFIACGIWGHAFAAVMPTKLDPFGFDSLLWFPSKLHDRSASMDQYREQAVERVRERFGGGDVPSGVASDMESGSQVEPLEPVADEPPVDEQEVLEPPFVRNATEADLRDLEDATGNSAKMEYAFRELAHDHARRMRDPDAPVPEQACGKEVRSDTRVLLMAVANGFHGSTALSQTLMGSPSLATLCSAGTWQCEGAKMGTNFKQHLLETYARHWNLSKPVLFDKTPKMLDAVPFFYLKYLHGRLGGQDGAVPPIFRLRGIQRLNVAFVTMWRPLCLAPLSSHTPDVPTYLFAKKEALYLQNMMMSVKWMRRAGYPNLVLSFGQMMFQPQKTQHFLRRYLPCLPGLDVSFVPQMGVDIFPQNHWKVNASVASFKGDNNPASFGYNAVTDRCEGEWTFKEILANDDPDLLVTAQRAQRFLRKSTPFDQP